MPLQFADLRLQMTQGIAGKENPKISQGPLVLENANFDEIGAINKRPTYTASARANVRNIVSRDDFSVLYESVASGRIPGLTSYNSVRSYYESIGEYLSCLVEVDKTVLGAPPQATDLRTLDCAVGLSGTNLVFYGYQSLLTATTFYSQYLVTKNTTTGQTVDVASVVDAGTNGRFVTVGTYGHVWIYRRYVGAALGECRLYRRAAADTYWSTSSGQDPTSGALGAGWDVCWWKDDQIAIVFLDAAGHVNITTWDVGADAQVGTVDTGIAAAPESALSIWSDNHASTPKIVIGYEVAASHDYAFMVYDSGLNQTVAPFAFHALGATNFARKVSVASKPDANANTLAVALSYDGAIAQAHTVVGEINIATGAVVGGNTTIWYSRLQSRLLTIGKEAYFWVHAEIDWTAYGANVQPGAYLMTRSYGQGGAITQSIPVAHALSGYAHETYVNETYDLGKLCNLTMETLKAETQSYRLWWAHPYTTTSSAAGQKQGAAVSVTLSPFLLNTRIDRNHLLSGGFLHALGNSSVSENGWLQYPKINALSTATPGGSMSDGTYSFVVVFEHVDEDGQLHRSAPSLPVSITLSAGGAGQYVSVSVRTSMIATEVKNGTGRYVAYRTTNAGSIYYATGASSVPATGTAVTNITAVASDATIAALETLYTTGGVLDAIAPPSPKGLARASDRAFLLSGEDPSEVWYSKPKEEGIATEFNDGSIVRFPEPLECIAYYDAKLYGFTKQKIYMVYGDGPNALGQGGQFSLPQLVSTVTGCENPYSIIETPQGLMFQSHMTVRPYPALSPSATASESAGLWQLSGQGVTPVLAPDDFSFYPITSAANVTKRSHIVYTCWGYTGAALLLAYDYIASQWSTHPVTEAGTTVFPMGAVVGGLHQFVTGAYWYKQGTSFAAADTMKIRTPWIKVSDSLAGYGRVRWVYLVGTYKSAHTLNIKVYYDYNDSSAVETVTASITTTQTPYLYRFKPGRQRCSAIMLEIYDSDQAGTYESFSLDEVVCNVGRKSKNVLPSARTL